VRQADLPKDYGFDHAGEKAAARTGTITEKQVQCLTNNLAPHLKPVFLTAIYTGARPKEIRNLKNDDVRLDGDAPRIIVHDHKNSWRPGLAGKPKILAIVDELLPVLTEWKKNNPSKEWFFHLKGAKLGDWKTAWNAALRRCEIEKGTIKFYDARRTARTILGNVGVSKDDAKAQLGHLTDAMSDRYNQSTEHVGRIIKAHRTQGNGSDTTTPTASSNDVVGQVERLADMFEKGLLTADEFATLKAKLLL
jgi:integrase